MITIEQVLSAVSAHFGIKAIQLVTPDKGLRCERQLAVTLCMYYVEPDPTWEGVARVMGYAHASEARDAGGAADRRLVASLNYAAHAIAIADRIEVIVAAALHRERFGRPHAVVATAAE